MEICKKKLSNYSPISQGIIAFKSKIPMDDCPFPTGEKHDLWVRGWQECSKSLKMQERGLYEDIFISGEN